MSGIIGILHSGGRPVDASQLQRMTEAMTFRGPDAQNVWVDGSVGFGHTLLKTTFEADGERQPRSLDGNIWITADARIDDRKGLMCRLELDREPSKTFAITDPELILHAYHRWGSECVDHLLGDFALAIWDGKRRQLFCARDHFGVKPFYYVHTGDTLLIGNTLEILRRHPGVTGSIDEIAVADFLLFGSNMHHERTAFEEIRKLPPASILTWSPGNGLQRRRYWRLPVPEPLRRKRSKDTIDQFLDLMRTAVGDRMRTGNIGLSLSGGMDSTTVAAMAAEYRDTRPGTYDLRACTVYDGRWIKDDEHRFSKVAADALDIPVRAVNTANDQLSVKRDTMRRWTMAPLSEPVTAASNIELKALSRGCVSC